MHSIPPRIVEVVDRILMEQGELDPFECLLELGLITRPDYANRRGARHADLESALRVPLHEAVAALEQAQSHARAQGLVADPPATVALHATHGDLTIGSPQRLTELCGRVMRLPGDDPQADLFRDGAPAVALHGLRAALAGHRLEAAREALDHFGRVAPGSPGIDEFRRLLAAVAPSPPAPERLRELDSEIAPLAKRLLGPQARDYLSPLWVNLAETLAGTGFSPDAPKLHASYAYGQARRWREVAGSVEAEPDWHGYAELIIRLAEARARQGREDAARPLWMKLCWEHPTAADSVLTHAPGDPVLARLWAAFLDAGAELAVGDFPAWLLLADRDQPRLVPAETAPGDAQGRVYAAMHRVVTNGADLSALDRKFGDVFSHAARARESWECSFKSSLLRSRRVNFH